MYHSLKLIKNSIYTKTKFIIFISILLQADGVVKTVRCSMDSNHNDSCEKQIYLLCPEGYDEVGRRTLFPFSDGSLELEIDFTCKDKKRNIF